MATFSVRQRFEEEQNPTVQDPAARGLERLLRAAGSADALVIDIEQEFLDSKILRPNMLQIERYAELIANPDGGTPELKMAFQLGGMLGLRALRLDWFEHQISSDLYTALNRYYIDAWRLMSEEDPIESEERTIITAHLMSSRIGDAESFGDVHNDTVSVIDGIANELFDEDPDARYMARQGYVFVNTAIDWHKSQPPLESALGLQRKMEEAELEAQVLDIPEEKPTDILARQFFEVVSKLDFERISDGEGSRIRDLQECVEYKELFGKLRQYVGDYGGDNPFDTNDRAAVIAITRRKIRKDFEGLSDLKVGDEIVASGNTALMVITEEGFLRKLIKLRRGMKLRGQMDEPTITRTPAQSWIDELSGDAPTAREIARAWNYVNPYTLTAAIKDPEIIDVDGVPLNIADDELVLLPLEYKGLLLQRFASE